MGDIVSCRPFLLRHPLRTTYGSGSNAITESTTYTIQGWTESKWSDLLRQNWHYENSSLPSWTGNITRWDWRHLAAAGETDSSGNAASYQQRSELFSYDGLNRLSGSAMTIGTGATATSDSRWSERNIRYDLEGNILHLERYQGNANTPQATLDFSYDGPKRNGYSYDSNGNITYDPLRCFEIRYNLLNLAAEVIGHDPEDTAAEGTLLCETVYYADGTRSGVRRPNDGPWLTRYVSSLICNGDSEFLYPMGVVSDFGYIDLQSGKMQYFLRDHLGSVRVIAEDRHTVISRTDYLPFGVRMSGDGLTGANSTARSSFFGFSGKENEMWGGYDTADGDITPHWLKGERYQHFGARAYDPVSCIFMQVDPMAEKYYGMTSYGYCAGNPVMFMDPQGDTLIADQSAQLNIKHTLSAREARYVRFDESGQLDNTRLLKSNSNSTNMTALKLLSSCTTLYLAIVSDNAFGDVFYEKGSKIDYPENFNYGVTCMPNASQNPSPDNNVYIFTAFFLNSEGKVTNTAHELYGHAYFYELSKTSDVNPNHVYGVVGKGISYEEGYGFLEHNIYGETNLKLLDQINKATNEAIKNFKKYWDNF